MKSFLLLLVTVVSTLAANPPMDGRISGGRGGGGSSVTGMLTNQFTTNVVGSPIVGDVNFAEHLTITNTSNGSGLTNLAASAGPWLTNNDSRALNLTNSGNKISAALTNQGGGANWYAVHDANKKLISTLDGGSWTNLNGANITLPITVTNTGTTPKGVLTNTVTFDGLYLDNDTVPGWHFVGDVYSSSGFFGSGANLTALNASSLSSGTIGSAVLTGSNAYNGSFTGNGSGLTNLAASNIVSGGVLPMGTVATNSAFDGAFLTASNSGMARVWTKDGSSLTNISMAALPSNVATNNGNNQFSAAQTLTLANNTALGVGGLMLTNPTVATLNNQKASPTIVFGANGWATTGSTSAPVIWTMGVTPVQGTYPNADFVISNNVAGSPLASSMRMTANGAVTFASSITSGGAIVVGSGSTISDSASRFALLSQSSGALQLLMPSQTAPITNFYLGPISSSYVLLNSIAGTTPTLKILGGTGGVSDLIVGGQATATNGVILPYTNAPIKFINVGATNAWAASATTAYIVVGTNGGGGTANSAEIYTLDGAGNYTLISPHASDSPAGLDDNSGVALDYIVRHHNIYLGAAEWINVSRLARRVEQVENVLQTLIGLANTNGLTALQIARLQQFAALTTAEKNIIAVRTNFVAAKSWSVVQQAEHTLYATSYTNDFVSYQSALASWNPANTNGIVSPVPPAWSPPPVYPVPARLSTRGVQ